MEKSAKEPIQTLPARPVELFLVLLGHEDGEVKVAAARVDVHVVGADEAGAVVELVAEPHDEDDGDGHALQKELTGDGEGRHLLARDGWERPAADPELGDEEDGV